MKGEKIKEHLLPQLNKEVWKPATTEDLKKSGIINTAFVLNKGDVITFPQGFEDTFIVQRAVGNKGNHAVYFGVMINGVPDWMPLGTLRRLPYRYQEIWKDDKYKTNMEFIGRGISDNERLALVHGKQVIVEDVEELDTTIYDEATNSSKKKEDGTPELTKRSYPIYKEVE